MNNTCIYCGKTIPEGRQICPPCEKLLIKSPKSNNFQFIRNKQIEEMREITCDHTDFGVCNSFDRCDDCPAKRIANALYDADYRKQSEGEWKAYPDEHEICATEFVCSNCKESFCTNEMTDWQFIETMKFCPNCGAKMKNTQN